MKEYIVKMIVANKSVNENTICKADSAINWINVYNYMNWENIDFKYWV